MRGPWGRGGASSTGVYFTGTAAAGHRRDSTTHDGAAAGAVFPFSAVVPDQAAMEIGLERPLPARKEFTGCHVGGFFAAGDQDGGGAGRRVGIGWETP
jgi:hypothetical protein